MRDVLQDNNNIDSPENNMIRYNSLYNINQLFEKVEQLE